MSRFKKIKKRPSRKVRMSDLDIEELIFLWESWHNKHADLGVEFVTVKDIFMWLRKENAFEGIEVITTR